MNCRILYVVGQLRLGGLERQLCYLLHGMERDRYRPAVAVWNFSENDVYVSRLRALGVPLYNFPDKASPLAKLVALRTLIRRLQPEVIHSYSFFTNVAAWWASLRTKAIPIGAVRSDFISDKRACGFVLAGLSARLPEAQIYNNFVGAEKARNSSRLFTPRQIIVVRNGLDLSHFKKVPLPSNGQARISGVGSLLQIKRWDRLLTAAWNLKKMDFDFLVEIAGVGSWRESLEQRARHLGLLDRVTFTGPVEDISGLLANSTLLAHTSDVEGCPNVIMEAMACGRAVVATDAGDIPSLVDDGKTGFVVRRGDDQRLVERLATLITNRDLCRKMGEAGRAKAEREFGLDRLVKETLAAYKSAGWQQDPANESFT